MEERARALLATLLEPIAPERRGEVLREVVEALERGYRATGGTRPRVAQEATLAHIPDTSWHFAPSPRGGTTSRNKLMYRSDLEIF